MNPQDKSQIGWSSWAWPHVKLSPKEKKKTCKNRRRGKDFPSRLSYWWASEWSMLAHAEDSDAFSLHFPRSFSILLPSFPLSVICLWQFYLYVVYQHALPGLIHSSFLQEGVDVFLAAAELMCAHLFHLVLRKLYRLRVKKKKWLSKSTQWDTDSQTQHACTHTYTQQVSGVWSPVHWSSSHFSLTHSHPSSPKRFPDPSFLQLLSPLSSQDAPFLYFLPHLSESIARNASILFNTV